MSSQVERTDRAQLRRLVGANIDRGIRLRGLTNRAVGTAIDKSEMEVSRWRRGLHMPSKNYRAALARVLFDGDLDELYRTDRPNGGSFAKGGIVPTRRDGSQ